MWREEGRDDEECEGRWVEKKKRTPRVAVTEDREFASRRRPVLRLVPASVGASRSPRVGSGGGRSGGGGGGRGRSGGTRGGLGTLVDPAKGEPRGGSGDAGRDQVGVGRVCGARWDGQSQYQVEGKKTVVWGRRSGEVWRRKRGMTMGMGAGLGEEVGRRKRKGHTPGVAVAEVRKLSEGRRPVLRLVPARIRASRSPQVRRRRRRRGRLGGRRGSGGSRGRLRALVDPAELEPDGRAGHAGGEDVIEGGICQGIENGKGQSKIDEGGKERKRTVPPDSTAGGELVTAGTPVARLFEAGRRRPADRGSATRKGRRKVSSTSTRRRRGAESQRTQTT